MIPLVDGALRLGTALIERLFPDPQQQNAAKLALLELQQRGDLEALTRGAGIVEAEARSEHPLTSQWRPITMLMFVAIIGHNYILYPYLRLFFPEAPLLEVPPDLWDLIKLGLGGYVIGRSAEKTVRVWKEGRDGR